MPAGRVTVGRCRTTSASPVFHMHPLAGKPAPTDLLIDVARLERDYYARQPNLADPTQLVSFGTSGHRGTPFEATFTEAHILAITQAICEYRSGMGINGPLFLGKDTHAASHAAERTALEVLAANQVQVVVQRADGYTPTPVISHAILTNNSRNAERHVRRHRHHTEPQSASGRRLQVQPPQRRPGGCRGHHLDPGPGERAAPRGESWRPASDP